LVNFVLKPMRRRMASSVQPVDGLASVGREALDSI
jgi:hypothetical protein